MTLFSLSESITTSSSSSRSIGIGSLVGGVLAVLCDEVTDRALAAAEEFRALTLVKRDSGVFGSIADEERGIVDLYFASDVLEMEVADFCKGLAAGVFGAGPFEKKDVKLFCFIESVEAVSLDDIVTEGGLRS